MSVGLLKWVTIFFALVAPVTSLAQVGADSDPNPLKPADTSSPRATLRSFVENVNEAVEIWRRVGAQSGYQSRASYRALDTLDLSEISTSESRTQQVKRVLLLKEVLDRIAVPPFDEIPGKEDVRLNGLTRWTIPNTEIVIERQQTGHRAGEFLFSGATVARLDRFYDLAKHLPYKPGATKDIYRGLVEEQTEGALLEARIQNRIGRGDRSSPKSTLRGFIESVNRAYALVRKADLSFEADPPTISRKEAREIERRADSLLRRAILSLDLGKIPSAFREDAGLETALKLKEVLDRIRLPEWENVPDVQTVRDWENERLRLLSTASRPFRWRVPNTAIEIVEVIEGARAGEFLFSPETVSRVTEFYDKVKDLPYQPGASKGFYRSYISTPGYLVPDAILLAQWIDELPAWLTELHYGQTVWQWIIFALSVLVFGFAVFVVNRVTRRLARPFGTPLRNWVRALEPALIAVIILGVREFIDTRLNITGDVLQVTLSVATILLYGLMGWFVIVALNAFSETIIASRHLRPRGVDSQLLRLGFRLLSVILVAALFIEAAEVLGLPAYSVVAGLGIGGLAVALAAREILADFLGSVVIMWDRPFRIGDLITIGENEGFVTNVGFRSTRIRTIYDSVLTVPNSETVKNTIDNLGERRYRRIRSTVSITYDTPVEKIEGFLEGIKNIVKANPATRKENYYVVLHDFGSHSLDIEVSFFVIAPDRPSELAERHRVFLEIIRLAEAMHIRFAFPTQTLQVESFPGQAAIDTAQTVPDPQLQTIARAFGPDGANARPRGSGLFTPPNEEKESKAS